MHAFVTGGSGFVGGHVTRRLAADGHRVTALARSSEAADRVRDLGAEPAMGDVADRLALEAGMSGAEAAYHCAAWVGTWGDRTEIWRVNVDGTRAVLDAARRTGVRRVVHVSTESVLLDGSSFEGTDETRPYPDRFLSDYAETKAVAERLVLEANGDDLETIALRPRQVWGPGDDTWFPALAAKVRSGVFRWVDDGRHLGSSTHVQNLVEALMLATDRGHPGEVYFVTDGPPRTFREFATRYLGAAGIEIPDRSAPGWLMRALASVVERIWKLFRIDSTPPLVRVEASMVSHPQWFDDSKARRELGYEPVVTFEEGMDRLERRAR